MEASPGSGLGHSNRPKGPEEVGISGKDGASYGACFINGKENWHQPTQHILWQVQNAEIDCGHTSLRFFQGNSGSWGLNL